MQCVMHQRSLSKLINGFIKQITKEGVTKDMAKVIDGHVYQEGEPIHDLGSFECVDVEGTNQRNYEGLSADVDKLPTYDELEAGSSALCLDTLEYYKYHAKSKTWYKLGQRGDVQWG